MAPRMASNGARIIKSTTVKNMINPHLGSDTPTPISCLHFKQNGIPILSEFSEANVG